MSEKTEGKALTFADLTFVTPTGAQIIEFIKETPDSMLETEAYANAAATAAGVDVDVILALTGDDFWLAVDEGKRLFTKPARIGHPEQSEISGKPVS
ncbi:hypothetical protein [uncultured Cohaesibacter sp.]|uniref:hypothetical protein n=1 Tax=uncultured Cohaesibacter sp. TaxID=1002546 RepID=UPI0029C8AFF3|nr:hypothetical protein [uncultured Cohaesibacter sp.]